MRSTRLIVRISDYIFRKEEKIKKGIDEVMGGKVLQLESERLFELGEARGKIIGKAEGKAEGEAIGETRIGKIIDSAEACRELYKEYGL